VKRLGPPAFVITPSVIVGPEDFDELRRAWYRLEHARYRAPASRFEEYRRDLYGPRTTDWFPFLNYGLVVAVLALVIAVGFAIR
jgi:hypothetical protein